MSINTHAIALPAWLEIGLIPILNLALALFFSGLIMFAIGVNPIEAVGIMLRGAFGYDEAIGYTLYYTTNFIFTGLAVAVAFHASLFNIGGEGQAYIGGLGVGLVFLALDSVLPPILLVPVGIAAAGLAGAAWAFIPAWLQAYRGSHIVITTIMFNFIASSIMVYLLVKVLIKTGQMSPETRLFDEAGWMPFMHEMLAPFGIEITRTPLNASFLFALLCCLLVWLYIWRTRWGYELRTAGQSEGAARYAGIRPKRVIIIAMCISGALAGFVAVNEIMGVHHRLLLNFTAGYGFTGIAVALMGRNHPVGIIMASLLFGVLYQGGAELEFEIPKITREMVVAIQGLIILFSGALALMLRPMVVRAWLRFRSVDDVEPA
ncbi:MAG: sugar ABC transporter permease [Gammaproteobacteria bacterium]|nr:MAG: sugar ABC transporter permease [Gammaproteobacteria bacterium]PIE36806.1 MAG: sugar ABC transporter permease [Gammaproteobacteria bacterium]